MSTSTSTASPLGGRRERDEGAAAEHVALIAERLATLMSGGASPATAWRLIARAQDAGPAPKRIARRIRLGQSIPGALRPERDPSWRALGAAWEIASRSGAPVSPSLDALAEGLRDAAAGMRNAQIARSGPIATARLVNCLPLAGTLLGIALGLDPLSVLLGTGHGLGCLAAGIVLMLLGTAWSTRLAHRAAEGDKHPALALDLIALGMTGGGSAAAVIADARRSARAFRLPAEGVTDAERALRLASEAGVPASGLLRREARAARALAAARARLRAERLSVTMLLPLGTCTLPAFIALGVVPIVLSIMRSTLDPAS